MNPKFFDVKKEKQDAIINACLKVFAENGYKKASTDVIVKTAGISKGLLFHYFESKKGAYEFIFDYSVKYMTLELTQSVKKSERDFFEIQRTIEGVKTRVMKNYPYMQQFLDSVRFEEHPDALTAIGKDKNVLRETYGEIYRQADMSRFDDTVDVNRVINMIGWMSEGYIKDRFREEEEPDLDDVSEEFAGYLHMLRNHLYRAGDRRLSFAYGAKQTGAGGISVSVPRNTGMARTEQKAARPSSLSQLANQMNKEAGKPELSFEERLARRDTSIFGVPVPPKTEKKEEEKEEKKEADNIEEKAEESKSAEAKKEEKKEDKIEEVKAEEAKTEPESTGKEQEEQIEEAIARETEKIMTEAEEGNLEEEQPETTAETGEVKAEEILPEPPAEKEISGSDADSDMIDLSALFSKRLEEATEELMIDDSAGQEYIYPEIQTEDPMLYGGQEEYYPQEQYPYPFEGYDPNMGFPGVPPLPEGYVFEDDSQAYAELYNSVNNYDVNGTTQEMPVNEVLAYRNAFTNEFIRDELEGNGDSGQQAADSDKKEKKAKKKSFFSGWFGKSGKDEAEADGSQGTGTDEIPE